MTWNAIAILKRLLFILVLLTILGGSAWWYFHARQITDYSPAYHEYAYVTNGQSNSVSVLDLLQLRNVKTIPVGTGPTGVATNPARKRHDRANNHYT